MNPIVVSFGPFTITWYALFIVSGLMIGSIIGAKEAQKHNIKEDSFYDMLFYLLIFSFLGARIWYVVFQAPFYLQNPSEIIKIWHGGLAIHGGIIGGTSYLIYYAKKYNIKFFTLTDIAVPSLILGQAIGRWGNFMNSEAHGGATTYDFLANTLHLPSFIVNGMHIDGVYYHPTFLYESTWNIVGFLILILFLRKRYRFNYGILSGFYLMWYGFIRFFIEMMRTDALLFGPIKVAQLTSFLMFVLGLVIIIKKKRGNNE